MPKVKPIGTPKKKLTKLEKSEKRAAIMVANELDAHDKYQKKRFDQCVEMKMLKGHSRELAEKMAKELIYNTHEV